mmetsp:Transcript_25962/g.30737  ORF Transcript_25962/g.30737 Transcript_25962/m.30737 type:complete len:127 (-) Transcript_25962:1124-1504(-)
MGQSGALRCVVLFRFWRRHCPEQQKKGAGGRGGRWEWRYARKPKLALLTPDLVIGSAAQTTPRNGAGGHSFCPGSSCEVVPPIIDSKNGDARFHPSEDLGATYDRLGVGGLHRRVRANVGEGAGTG